MKRKRHQMKQSWDNSTSLTQHVIRSWNEAIGINLSVPKIKMIDRSWSRQGLSQHSNSELLCPEWQESYLSTFAKSGGKSPLRERRKVLCLKEAEQAQIKTNQHNNQEHEGKKKGESIFSCHFSNKKTWPEIKEDVTEGRAGVGVWVGNESTGLGRTDQIKRYESSGWVGYWWSWPVPIHCEVEQKVNWISDIGSMRWMGQKSVGGERSLAGTTKNHHAWQEAGPCHAVPRTGIKHPSQNLLKH